MTSADAPQNSGAAPAVQSPFLTTPEVADILRIDVWAVVKLCRDGKLAATKPGQKWLIARTDLDAYIEAGRNAAAEAVSA